MATDRWILSLALAALAAAPGTGGAQVGPHPVTEVPMLDPWVPPAVREKSLRVPVATEGAALRAQVEGKLRRRFEAASGPGGTLTRDQARNAGLAAIARDFDAIDRAGRGAIRFEDYLRHLDEGSARPR